jgi:hypothetical protein
MPWIVGQRRGGGDEGFDDALVGGDELVAEPTDVARQLERDPLAFDLDRLARPDAAQDPPGLGSRQQAASTAWRQATEQGVKPADRLGAQPSEVVVPVRQQPQHCGVIHRGDPAQPGMPQRHDRRGPGLRRGRSCRCNPNRAAAPRAESVAGTSSTVSPAATSCCASNAPSPQADSMAQVRGMKLAAKWSSRSRWRRSALTRSSPITVSQWSSTAAVWDPLWGSIHDEHEALLVAQPVVDATAGTPDEGRLLAPVSGPRRSENPASGHFALKPTSNRWAGHS